jgi:putative multiple sugar transport system permease protein
MKASDRIREIVSRNLRQYTMLIALIVIMLFFEIATGGILLLPRNTTKLILQNSYILILAIGMMLCILSGGNIDLSVGSLVALVSAMSGLMCKELGVPAWIAIIIGLLTGLLAGMWQGFWIAFVKIPAFIVTLAGMLIFRGINNLILNGNTLMLPQLYISIASDPIMDFVGGKDSSLNITSLIVGLVVSLFFVFWVFYSRGKKKLRGYEVPSFLFTAIKAVLAFAIINVVTYWLARDEGIPIILVILAALYGIYTFISTKTIAGRHLYAMGGNAKAAQLSGIDTKKILFVVYSNMGLLSAIAGIVYAGRLNSASPTAGQNFELEAIAACFIGGASATGGIGTIMGAIVGGFIMGVMNNGMSIIGLSIFWQDVAKGLLTLLAVAFDVYSKSKAKVR